MASPKKSVHLSEDVEASPRGPEPSQGGISSYNSFGNLSRLVRDASSDVVSMWRDPVYRGELVTDAPSTSAPTRQRQQLQQLKCQRRKQQRDQQTSGSPGRQGPSNFTRLPEIPLKPRSLPASPAGTSRPPRHHRPGSHTQLGRVSFSGDGINGPGKSSFIAGATVAGPLTPAGGLKPALSGSATAVTAAALFAVSAGQIITAASIAYTSGNGTIMPPATTGTAFAAAAAAATGGGGGGSAAAGSVAGGSGTPEHPSTAAAGGAAAGVLQPQISASNVHGGSGSGDSLGLTAPDDDVSGSISAGRGSGGVGRGNLLMPLDNLLADDDERLRTRLVSLPNIVCRSANGDVFLVDLSNVQAMLHKRELGEEGLAILNRLTPSVAAAVGTGGGIGGGAGSLSGGPSRRRGPGQLRRPGSPHGHDANDVGGGAGGSNSSPFDAPALTSRSPTNAVSFKRSASRARSSTAASAAALQRGALGAMSTVERDAQVEAELGRHLAATDRLVDLRRQQLQEEWQRGRIIAANPTALAKEQEEARRAAAIDYAVHRFVPRRFALMALNMPPGEEGAGGEGDTAAAGAAAAVHGSGDGSGDGGCAGHGASEEHRADEKGVFGAGFKARAHPQHWKQLQTGMDRLYDKMPFMKHWMSTIRKLHREERAGWDGLLSGVDELYVKGREEHQGTNIYVLKCHELGVTPSTQVIQQLSSADSNMSHCRLGRQGAAALRHALSANVTITNLNLRDNHLDAAGLDSILAGLYSGTMAKQPKARKLLEKRIQNATGSMTTTVNGHGGGGAAVPTSISGSAPPSPTRLPAGGGAARLGPPCTSPPRRAAPGELAFRLIPAHLAQDQEQRRRQEEERQRQEKEEAARGAEAARGSAEGGARQEGPEWLRLITQPSRSLMDEGIGDVSHLVLGPAGASANLPGRKAGANLPGQPPTANRLTCAITALDLSNNPLGLNGVRALADLLDPTVTPYQFIKTLLLNKCGIPEGGGRALALALSRGNTRLAVLGLSNNALGNATAAMLGEVLALPSGLEDLDLSWNQIKTDGARALSEGISQNNTLTRLNLSWNGLENAGVEALGGMLLRNESLSALDLTNTRLGAEACLVLAEGIRNNRTLESLTLNGNSVGDDGARFLMEALKVNSSLRYLGLQGTNMSAAARGSSAAASFNPLSPDGSYELNLEASTDRAVALQLCAMDAAAPTDLMRNIRLGERNVTSCKAMHWPECLPVSGVLSFDFVTRRVSKCVGVMEAKTFTALAAQCGSSTMSDKEKLALVEVMAPFNYVLCHQAAALLRTFSIGDEMVAAAALLFTRCADLDENVRLLSEALGAEASVDSLQGVLGWYSYIRFSNPTGHYELSLTSRVHAALASRLKDEAYSEPVECLNWHNTLHDTYTRVTKVAANFGPPEEWHGLVPHVGTLSFDYVSGCLVPESACPVSDQLLDEVISGDLGIPLDPSGQPLPTPDVELANQQVARLRPRVSHLVFTARQVKKLVEAFAASPHRVEVLVTCYCLIVDRSNMWTILYEMEPLEQALVTWRLGPANLLDKAHPTGHYVLDLTNPHHEGVARKLVELAMAAPELPNFWNLRVNGVRRSVIENRNMWGAFMAESQTPFLEFDFIGLDGWEAVGRSRLDVEALGAGDRLDLRTKQARRLELSRTRSMYAYYEDGSGWPRAAWQSRPLLMKALADKAPWQAAWDRMMRLLLRAEIKRGGVEGDSPLEDLFFAATAGEDAMTAEQWEGLVREWGYNRLEVSFMCDAFESEARPANPKDGPAYKPVPPKPATPTGGRAGSPGADGGGGTPPAPPAASSPLGRSAAGRDRVSRQQSQAATAAALAAAASAFTHSLSSPPGSDLPSPPRGRPGAGALPALLEAAASQRSSATQSAAQLHAQPPPAPPVPNLVVEFPAFVRLFMREPPRSLRALHNAASAVLEGGVELVARPTRRNTGKGRVM